MNVHVADGVLSFPVAVATTAGAIGILAYSLKGIKEDEIPKISLLTGAFFVSSLINIPVGPTSIHPLLSGFLGLALGRRAPIGIFIGLLLQAALFQHGGLSTLGANTLLMSLPAYLVYFMSQTVKQIPYFLKGFAAGFGAVLGGVFLLILLLLLSDQRYTEGTFSVINIVLVAYFPLAILEGVLTGFSVKYLYTLRPTFFEET
ncbi:CbiM family transporter [Alkalihalobacterium elongatum]|uniref:CbiM family transporter n=1 Tax=Alkalihalobacterium elongatum TaxID=2675466 RepID=UPI001C1FED83|nr:CbiM family transporter [Alkalihalobacterium elongatum]